MAGTDVSSPVVAAGESYALALDGLAPGTYTVVCTLPGHHLGGMEATLSITAGG